MRKKKAPPTARRAFGAAMISVLCVSVAYTGPSYASSTALPDPCAAIPSTLIASAFRPEGAPQSSVATVRNVSTCSYGNDLTVSVGTTAIVNPAYAATVVKVPGLPHGTYMTYKGSTQTEILFYSGSAANAIYGVVRNFATIKKAPLERIATALFGGITGQSDPQATPSARLIGG